MWHADGNDMYGIAWCSLLPHDLLPPMTGDSRPCDILVAVRTFIVWHDMTWHDFVFPSDRRQQTVWCSDGSRDMYSIAWHGITWHGMTCFPQWQVTADYVTCWWHWGRVTGPQKCVRSQKEGLSASEWLFVSFYCASLIVGHGWCFCHTCWPCSWCCTPGVPDT